MNPQRQAYYLERGYLLTRTRGAATMPKLETDEELMERVKLVGDPAAMTELIQRHRAVVFGMLFRRTGNQADAEDLSQRTWQQVWSRRFLYNSGHPFRPWLLTIAARLAIGHHRWKTR